MVRCPAMATPSTPHSSGRLAKVLHWSFSGRVLKYSNWRRPSAWATTRSELCPRRRVARDHVPTLHAKNKKKYLRVKTKTVFWGNDENFSKRSSLWLWLWWIYSWFICLNWKWDIFGDFPPLLQLCYCSSKTFAFMCGRRKRALRRSFTCVRAARRSKVV